MSKSALRYIIELFVTPKRDFSVFVSESSKDEKERALKRAADRAIIQQLQVIEVAAA